MATACLAAPGALTSARRPQSCGLRLARRVAQDTWSRRGQGRTQRRPEGGAVPLRGGRKRLRRPAPHRGGRGCAAAPRTAACFGQLGARSQSSRRRTSCSASACPLGRPPRSERALVAEMADMESKRSLGMPCFGPHTCTPHTHGRRAWELHLRAARAHDVALRIARIVLSHTLLHGWVLRRTDHTADRMWRAGPTTVARSSKPAQTAKRVLALAAPAKLRRISSALPPERVNACHAMLAQTTFPRAVCGNARPTGECQGHPQKVAGCMCMRARKPWGEGAPVPLAAKATPTNGADLGCMST